MTPGDAGSGLVAPPDAIVVLCAVPAGFDGEALAADLVERSLAACVQVGSNVQSVYRWKGSLEKTLEKLLLIKTRRALFTRVEAAILAAHPYEVPEILALRVSDGHAPFLAWVAGSTEI